MKTKARKVMSTGDFLTRIEVNVKYGWRYPKSIIRTSYPSGTSRRTGMNHGNIHGYYFFNGKKIEKLGSIPEWAGKNKSKYDHVKKRITELSKKGYPIHQLQNFVSLRY